jgi:hypothetical protein
MAAERDIKAFQNQLGGRTIFTLEEVKAFFRAEEPSIPQATIYWRMHALVKSGDIQRIGKGVYQLGETKIFVPEVRTKTKSIDAFIQKQFPFISYCQWNLSCINYFSRHLINFNVVFIDVERDVVDAVYRSLKENFPKVMAIPNLYDDLSEFNNAIFVRPLITEAPIQKVSGVSLSTLEKILVDLATDKEFALLQGDEIYTIFQSAAKQYTVNQNTLCRYAARKHKKEEMVKLLNTINRQ